MTEHQHQASPAAGGEGASQLKRGLSARHMRPDPDEVEALYGMADGRLMQRAYHVIDNFEPPDAHS